MTVDSVIESFSGWLSDGKNIEAILSILIPCAAMFLIAGFFRVLFGKRSSGVYAVNVALEVVIFYFLVILMPTILPATEKFLPSLPFITSQNNAISIMPIPEIERSVLAPDLLNLIILAFLFALAEDLLPEGKNIFLWVLLRFIALILVCGIMCFLNWFSNVILPYSVSEYAPKILLILLGIFLAVTVFKWLFGIIFGASLGPLIGGIYTFFISNIIGRQLTKSAIASAIVVGLLTLLWQYEKTVNFTAFPALTIILILTAPIATRYLIPKVF